MTKVFVLPFAVLLVGVAPAKPIKIHGYVTAVSSPSEFEIDEYKITKDATVGLEFEKSAILSITPVSDQRTSPSEQKWRLKASSMTLLTSSLRNR